MTPFVEAGLRDYLQVLRRRWWIAAVITVAGVVGALTLSALQTPLYQAQSRILVQQRTSSVLFDPQTGQALKPDLATEIELQLLTSQRVREVAVERLGRPAAIRASVTGNGTVLTLRANDPAPEAAAAEANAFAQAYLDVRRELAVSDYQTTADAVSAKMADIQAALDSVSAEVASAEATGNAAVLPGLRREEAALISQKDTFQSQLDQLLVSADLAQGGGPQVIATAIAPREPFRPTPVRNGILGGLAGLLVGVGLVFVVDHLDDSIRSKEDIETATGGLATLALVPRVPGWRNRTEPQVASLEHPHGAAAEAYRTLRTSVQFVGIDRPMKVVQVTSPRAQDGKTTTIVNLAVAFARAGKRVILLDCDLRRPRVHAFLGLDNEIGFTSVLLGDTELSEALRQTEQKQLVTLTAGPVPPAPSELLATRAAIEVIGLLADHCDLLLIDSPPVLPVSDALLLSSHVDGVVLVSAAGNTQRREVARAAELLAQVDAPVIGTVLNQASSDGVYGTYRYGGYSAYSSYAPDPDGTRGHGRTSRWRRKRHRDVAGDEAA